MSAKMVSVTVSSEQRDRAAWPDASDFVVDLGRTIERVKEVRLGTIEMPGGAAQMTVEDDWNDKVHFSEGWRVDTGEAPTAVVIDGGNFEEDASVSFDADHATRFGYPRNAPALYNHQLVIAQADEHGRYPPRLNLVLTVPAWLTEVRREQVADHYEVDPETVFETVRGGRLGVLGAQSEEKVPVPHGLADYQAYKASRPDAPSAVSAAMCTFADIHFDDPDDVTVVSESNVPPGWAHQFKLSAACVGYNSAGEWDANAPTKLNARRLYPDQRRHDCVACGFVHLESIQQRELCALLNVALARRPNRLNDYAFRFVGGEFRLECPAGRIHAHANGQSTAPRLFFRATRNESALAWAGHGNTGAPYTDPGVSVTPPARACTSLGHLMGFANGQPIDLVRHPRSAPEPIAAAIGGVPPHFTTKLLAGFYDASTLASSLVRRHNWGHFDGEAIGASETGPVSEFGFRDSGGCMHTVVVRSGRYYPFELAAAIEYQLDRLDANGARASARTHHPGTPAPGRVKYTVVFDRATSRFTLRCNRIVGIGPLVLGAAVDFGITFSAAQFRSASPSAAVGPALIAATLGFDGVDYAGRSEYVGSPVDVPSHATTLSQGVPNTSNVAPLNAEAPGRINGYGAGPWAMQYPSHPFGIAGTAPNTRRFRPNVRAHPATGDASVTHGPNRLENGLSVTIETVAEGALQRVLVAEPRGGNYVVGQLLVVVKGDATGGVVSVSATGADGAALALTVVEGGLGYEAGGGGVAVAYAPQGRARVVWASTGVEDDCAHRVILAKTVAEEAAPHGRNDVSGAHRVGARWFRSTTAPFGYQVGDVVRFEAPLQTNGRVREGEGSASIGVSIDRVRAAGSNAYPARLQGSIVGEVLKVTVTDGGTGYPLGTCFELQGPGTGAVVRATAVTAAGAVETLEIVSGGCGWSASPKQVTAVAVMGPYAQNGVVIESLNAGLNLTGADASTYALAARAATAPVAPLASTTSGATCLVAGTACVASPPGAGPTTAVDGSTIRVRVSQNVYGSAGPNTAPYARYAADASEVFEQLGEFALPTNLGLLKPTDPPRFEVLIEGRDPATSVKPASAYRVLGFGRRDLHSRARYLAPAQWCLAPVPYVILRLLDGQGHTEFNVVNHHGRQTSDVLAKILLGSALSQVNQQVQQLGCGGYRNYHHVRLQVLNPDFTPYHFHGADYSLSLCFVFDSDDVRMQCI